MKAVNPIMDSTNKTQLPQGRVLDEGLMSTYEKAR